MDEAELKQTEAQLAFRKTELVRAERLSSQGTIAESVRDRARMEVDTAAASVDSARASLAVQQRELERAEAALIETGTSQGPCCTQIRAPASGSILRILTEDEQVVQAGTLFMEIGDPGNLEIVTDVLSRDAVEIRPGASVVIDNWGGPTLAAKVRRVEPSAFTKVSTLGIEEQRVPVILDPVMPTDGPGLGHGFRVVARITIWEGKDILTVPLAALFRQGSDWAVYRVAEGRAVIQKVQIGRRDDSFAQVVSGLDTGASVIIRPSDRIADGTTVTPITVE